MKSKGNVLFLILIAVALFAALAYAVSGSTRSGTGTASPEKIEIAASQIVQYGVSVQTAVQRMTVGGQCAETQICFENEFSTYFASGTKIHFAGSCPGVPDSCKVFHPTGGNAIAMAPAAGSFPAIANLPPGATRTPGHPAAVTIPVQNVGTAAPDLVLFIPYVSDDVCKAINRKLGIAGDGGDYRPLDDGTGLSNFFGVYNGTGAFGEQDSTVSGQLSFCAAWNLVTNDNHYWHVLL